MLLFNYLIWFNRMFFSSRIPWIISLLLLHLIGALILGSLFFMFVEYILRNLGLYGGKFIKYLWYFLWNYILLQSIAIYRYIYMKFTLLRLKKTMIYNSNVMLLLMLTKTSSKKKVSSHKIDSFDSFLDNFVDFLYIWSLEQWVWSLITLFLLYGFIGYGYNKWLMPSGGWISIRARILMIVIDLLLNFIIGIYYMQYRETLIGAFLVRCPLAISPLIFIIEFVIVVWYYTTYTLPKLKSFLEKQEKERAQELSKLQVVKSNTKITNDTKKDIKDTKDIEDTESVSDVSNKDQKPEITQPVTTDKEKISTEDEEYVPILKPETRWSIQLQRTCWDKFTAACWQWSRYGRILVEPQGEEREALRKEINSRFEKKQKQKKISSTKSKQKKDSSDSKK